MRTHLLSLAALLTLAPLLRADVPTAPAKTPAQIQIKITSVDVPTDALEALNTQASLAADRSQPPPQDYLQLLQTAAAKTKTPLTITPGPALTTVDGIEGSVSARTSLPYTTHVGGKTQHLTQNLDNGMTALPRVNKDGTITVTLKVFQAQIAGPPAPNGGPLPITAQSTSTLRSFHSGETKYLGAFMVVGKTSHLLYATVTLTPPAKG